MANHRKICLSGIAEPHLQSLHFDLDKATSTCQKSIPSTKDLKRVRRFASKKQFSSVCEECRRVKRKCDENRPCNRCIASGLSLACDLKKSVDLMSTTGVDRPINFCVASVYFHQSKEYPQGNLKYHWSSSIIRPVWEIGYKYSSFVDIFNAVPETMSNAISNLLSAVAQQMQPRMNLNRHAFWFFLGGGSIS